ncbi:MAG: Deoxyribodipyrimidine photo-lyase [Ilumatobacteraceae bacterium]|nr:Deoxyribodipyrimidine photo-lyase [Ilumatobacteraceae bacterium]
MGDDVAVMWFRRDLRVGDNPALVAAAEAGRVVPLFVHDDVLARPSGANRVAYLHATLDSLAADVGGALVERTGVPSKVVRAVAAEVGASVVLAAEDFGPYGRGRDDATRQALAGDGRLLRFVGSPYAVAPGTVKTRSGTPFKVFTPFSQMWRQDGWDDPVAAPDGVRWVRGVGSDPRPETPSPEATEGLPPVGEHAAWEAAEQFLSERIGAYKEDRNRPDLDRTSRLSPHLKFGTIHPRQLLALLGDSAGATTFATELAWRDFYADVLAQRPDTVHANFVDSMDVRWDTGDAADERFEAWTAGRTGFPIVDAGMRQLLAEGWMHNRVRMITASFLVKDLHIDWRRGAAWFMRHLFDGDVASNTHGWQWTAGTGTDAAPFFRVFNPALQGRRFDPEGDYVRRHVPELRSIPGKAVHEPRTGADDLFSGEASSYPAPIVDHAAERDEALDRYRQR